MKAPEKFNAEALRAEAEKKIAEQEVISRLYPHIPDSVEGLRVFVCKTSYTADYLVQIEQERYSYSHPDKRITPDILRDLSAAFPPEPMGYYKGSFVSFLPVAVFEGWSEEKRDEYKEERRIAPFIVKVEGATFSQYIEICWHSPAVEGVGRVVVHVRLPLYSQKIGRSAVDYTKFPGGQRVNRNEFQVSDGFQILRSGSAGAEVAQMRYASGSDETPGQHVIFWEPYNPEPVPLNALIDAMEEAEKPQEVAR